MAAIPSQDPSPFPPISFQEFLDAPPISSVHPLTQTFLGFSSLSVCPHLRFRCVPKEMAKMAAIPNREPSRVPQAWKKVVKVAVVAPRDPSRIPLPSSIHPST